MVPLGNGALLAGVGTALRELAPAVEIAAAVAANAPAMQRSLESGEAVHGERADTIADGIAVRVPIASSLPLPRANCDAIVAASEAQLFAAMCLIRRHLGLVVEPAGAAGVAAILAAPARFAGRRVATILCGANIAPSLRAQLVEL